jgi:hypothetical protein
MIRSRYVPWIVMLAGAAETAGMNLSSYLKQPGGWEASVKDRNSQ